MNKLDKNKTYIVGVSGGCDSMYLLDHLRKENYSIVVCHVDYGIRNDTIEDYNVVKTYTDKYHIPFYFLQVKEYDQGNFQEQARNIRYDFFYETGKQYHTNEIVVAHHKDDIYETILLQKQRDTKRMYLGLKEVSKVRNCIVHRILLDTTKQEIIDYCKQNQLAYHDDYTNFQTHYQRDYIRNVVLTNMTMQEKEELLKEARSHNEKLEERKDYIETLLGEVIDLNRIKEEDKEDVLYYLCAKYVDRISNHLLEELKQCIKSEGNSQIDLPVNFVFIKEYNNIYVRKKSMTTDYSYHIHSIEKMETPFFKVDSSGHIYDGICVSAKDFPITIRNIRPGDRIETKVGYKKVSRVFIDKKIPASLRKTWPIVVNNKGEILIIPHIIKKFSYYNLKANLFVVKC